MRRSTPWVLGCCGPMLMIIDSSSETSTGCSSATSASARRSTAPFSMQPGDGVVDVGAGQALAALGREGRVLGLVQVLGGGHGRSRVTASGRP